MVAVPAVVRSEEGTATRKVEASTKNVVRALPFHEATAPGTNPLPETMTYVLPAPAATEAGVKVETAGVGFVSATCGRTNGPRSKLICPVPTVLLYVCAEVRKTRPSWPHRRRLANALPDGATLAAASELMGR